MSAGDSVVVGAPIAERLRDPRLDEREIPDEVGAHPGGRWIGATRRGEERGPGGEYAFEWHDRWRVATGDIADPVEAPFAGIVREVRPGVGITIRAAGRGIRGIVALGGPTRGRLQTGADGELRSGGLDVGSAGTILVVGSRVDAETLTRARAMGVCGVVVAGLSSKERRDFLASEARQRAALHRLPSFAVLVLDGASRRPLAAPSRRSWRALAGREVAIVDRSADARLRHAEPGHPRRRRSTSSASARERSPGARAALSRPSGHAASPAASSLRPASSISRMARPPQSRSATSTLRLRGDGCAAAGARLGVRCSVPSPVDHRAVATDVRPSSALIRRDDRAGRPRAPRRAGRHRLPVG